MYEPKWAEKFGATSYIQAHTHQRNLPLNLLDYGQGKKEELFPSQKFRVENFLLIINQSALSLQQRQATHTRICYFLVSCMMWIL